MAKLVKEKKMKIDFKNAELNMVYRFLSEVSAKGKQSRAVTKLFKLIELKTQEFYQDENVLIKDYAVCDEQGELVVNENGTFTFIEGREIEGREQHLELKNEIAIIDLTEYEPFFTHLFALLEGYEVELSGELAQTYDLIMDKIEKIKDEMESK